MKVRAKIPCLGYEMNYINGDDYDCEYENAGSICCEHCIAMGGDTDPRTGERAKTVRRFENSISLRVEKPNEDEYLPIG